MINNDEQLNLDELTVEQLHALRQEVRESISDLARQKQEMTLRLCQVEGKLIRKGEVLTLSLGYL